MKILILSQSIQYVNNLCQAARDLQIECLFTETCTNALNLITDNQINLLVIDHNPPEIEAISFLKSIKKHVRKPSVAIISPKIDLALACEAVRLGVRAIFPEQLELRHILLLTDEIEKELSEFQNLKEQHSRLALEYARLKQAYDDLRRAHCP